MVNNGNYFTPKKPLIYLCEDCHFECGNKKDFNRHLTTLKHKMVTNGNQKTPKNPKPYNCVCGKTYKHLSGLSRHKKTCSHTPEPEEPNTTDLIISVMQQNKELIQENHKLQQKMIDVCEQIPKANTTTTNTIHINNHIKDSSFNINVFLNEQCKDAMNMSEFVESIQVSPQDLALMGQLGQTNGMSALIIQRLKNLDIFERPIHCSDMKRETLYVKDADRWEKDEHKLKIADAIDDLSKKSIKTLPDLQQEIKSNDSQEYIQTVSEVLNYPLEDKKIISKIAKELYVKDNLIKKK